MKGALGSAAAGAAEAGGSALIGALLAGRYRVLEALASGGTGTVYRAVQEPLGREVAVKVLHPGARPGDEAVRRMVREAVLAGRLAHPNVVTVFDVGELPDGAPFVVLELLRGRTLREAIGTDAVDPGFAVNIALQLARGLRHAHRSGLVHRDVKPSNVILVRDDEGNEVAKLIDFGLVKRPGDNEITRSGARLGTLSYMAPEQLLGETVDARADVFALGVVFYRMLSGVLPFDAESPLALADQHAAPYPKMAQRSRVPVAADLEAIVQRCLARRPGERPDATRLVAMLKDAAGAPEWSGSLSVARPAPIEKPRRWRGYVASAALGLGAGVLVGGGVVAVLGGLVWWGGAPSASDGVAAGSAVD